MNSGINDKIGVAIAKHGLTVESEFVPYSRSRKAKEKWLSLNWKVTLKQNGRKILTTDYSAGYAHAPSYNKRDYNTVDGRRLVERECETGKAHRIGALGLMPKNNDSIKPESRDVIYSLITDSDVINYGSFEEWARDFGYNSDSRKDEKIYQQCLGIALKLNQIGAEALADLQEAFQDY